jgi:hypothetical protein
MLMNQWGCDECERRIEEIVGWLREEAEAAGIMFVAFAAKGVVKRAIKKARAKAEIAATRMAERRSQEPYGS